jgi:hypothetical protein
MSAIRAHDQGRDGLAGPDVAILARWPGRCPYCARPIRRGDLIVKVAGQWLHEDCDKATAKLVEAGR